LLARNKVSNFISKFQCQGFLQLIKTRQNQAVPFDNGSFDCMNLCCCCLFDVYLAEIIARRFSRWKFVGDALQRPNPAWGCTMHSPPECCCTLMALVAHMISSSSPPLLMLLCPPVACCFSFSSASNLLNSSFESWLSVRVGEYLLSRLGC